MPCINARSAQAVTEKEDALASVRHGGAMAAKLGVQTRVSLPMLETQQHRSQRAKHDAAQLSRVEELLRLRAENPKALSQALHLQPFEDVRCHLAACTIYCKRQGPPRWTHVGMLTVLHRNACFVGGAAAAGGGAAGGKGRCAQPPRGPQALPRPAARAQGER